MIDRMLRIDEVENMVGFRKAWVYRKIRAKKFPKPIKFGRNSRWRLSEVELWLNNQA